MAQNQKATDGRSETYPASTHTEHPTQGTWPAHCEQRAFVTGAAWWQFHTQDATMFPSERDVAEEEAVRRYGDPGVAAPAEPLTDRKNDPELGKPYPRIKGRCPSCGAESLFRGHGGYVTCSVIGCRDPGAASDLLAQHTAQQTELDLKWGLIYMTPFPSEGSLD